MEDMWYTISELDEVYSPALVIYKQRVKENIRRMIEIAGSPDRLMPHVKTLKISELVGMLMHEGIQRFKCATVAEAEMLGMAGAGEALIAYQPVGPAINRVIGLAEKYRDTSFSVVFDHVDLLKQFNRALEGFSVRPGVYIALNVGMGRTGIKPGPE